MIRNLNEKFNENIISKAKIEKFVAIKDILPYIV